MKQVEITSKIIGRGGSTTSASPSLDLSGYALISDLLNYVTISGNEDVTGLHDFVNGLKVGGLPITKKQDDVVYLDANLVVRGGITMYGDGEGGSSVPLYSTLGSLENVDKDAIDAVASVDRVLFQSAGSNVWSWKPLSEIGGGSSGGGSVSGNYLPLSGGTLTGDLTTSNGVRLFLNTGGNGIYIYNEGISFHNSSNNWVASNMGFYSDGSVLLCPIGGNVGIGTTSPQAKLSLENGNIDIYNTSGDWGGAIGFNRKSQLGGLYNSAFHGHQIQNYKGDLQFYIEKTDNTWLYPLVIQGSTGNVGIGTTSPSCKLHVNSTNNQVVDIVSSNKNEASIRYTNGAGNLWVAGTGAGKPGDYYGIWSNTLQYSPLVCSYEGAVIVDQVTYIAGGSIGFNRNTKYGGRFNTSYNGWQFYIDTSNSRFYVFTEGTNSGLKAYWDTSGNYLVYGGITMYSDQRKKTILNHVELSLKQIADAPLIEHYYNSDQDKTTHVGSIAQYWAGLNDWFCKLDNEGYYTMEIQNCALASAISIARHLEKYESKTDKKIRMLKQRITELEDKLEKLEGGKYGSRS